MTPARQIINSVTPAKKRSKLAPYLSEIQEFLNEGYSYRQIADVLEKAYGLKMDATKICAYVKRHNRQAASKPIREVKKINNIPSAVATQPRISQDDKQRKIDEFFSKLIVNQIKYEE
jgi:hypothetical protein